MNFAPVRWKDCTYRQNSCSEAFSSFYTLALHSFYGLASPCCRAMGVETVHGHEFLIFLHFRLGLSRKFWSGGKIGPGDQNFRNIGPGGPFFPENFGPPVKIMVRPAP